MNILNFNQAPSGTIVNALGLDTNGNLIQGTGSGGNDATIIYILTNNCITQQTTNPIFLENENGEPTLTIADVVQRIYNGEHFIIHTINPGV